jgi:hypothetical protein
VIFLTDFLPVVWIGENFVGNGDLLDEDFEVLGKTVSLGATGFAGFDCPSSGADVSPLASGEDAGFPQQQLI